MSEQALWTRLRGKMIPKYWTQATRHEDKFSLGIADVSFCQAHRHGWMELKHLHDWPKRPSTVVQVPHLTADQRAFLQAKGEGAGNTWLLMQVAGDHLLFEWNQIGIVGYSTKRELLESCHSFWPDRLLYDELAHALRTGFRFFPEPLV